MQSSGSGASRPRFPYHAQRSGRKADKPPTAAQSAPSSGSGTHSAAVAAGGGGFVRRLDSIERPTRTIEAPRSVSSP